MDAYERNRIEALAPEDPELERLWREHVSLEDRLNTLDHVRHRSPDEEVERKRLQKTKLQGMDRIAKIVAQYETK